MTNPHWAYYVDSGAPDKDYLKGFMEEGVARDYYATVPRPRYLLRATADPLVPIERIEVED